MTAVEIRGCCEECGKVYKVPSADRTYDCKACGGSGTVFVEAEQEDFDEEELDSERERLSTRFERRERGRGNSKLMWMLFGAVIALGLGALGMHKAGVFASEDGPPVDLDELAAAVIDDWGAADVRALGELYHPEGRGKFERMLQKAGEANGWSAGFPALAKQKAELTEGTVEDPGRARMLLTFGEDALDLRMQFDQGRKRWYVTGHFLTPPRVSPQVEAFREAWSQSDPEALTPFFHPDSAEKFRALVDRKAKQGGWAASYPTLSGTRLDGEEAARMPGAGLLGRIKVEASFTAGEGTMAVRWRYAPEDYAWYVTGFDFPG